MDAVQVVLSLILARPRAGCNIGDLSLVAAALKNDQ